MWPLLIALALGGTADPVIPLCPGLTIVTAINEPEGDYESIKRIDSVTKAAVALQYSAEIPGRGVINHVNVQRTILAADLKTATLYMTWFGTPPRTIPGSTAIGTSAAVLRALKTRSAAELGLVSAGAAQLRADPKVHPNVYDHRMNYKLTRVGTTAVMLPVTVNDAKLELPAIHARGEYMGDTVEFFFLDDESNPIALRIRLPPRRARENAAESLRLQVVKISYRCSPPSTTPASTPPAARLERLLLETGRAEVFDIYFSFNKDEIRAESEPTLREIAALLERHPAWKLTIEGHTDSIADAAYNLDLSQRRAAAVKNALSGKYGVSADRLTTTGLGESRPKDSNETLEGRARNRRVELVRQP